MPPPDRQMRLTLHYDGAQFHGWQIQPGHRTVQADLEAVLSRLADRPVRCVAAGRTDTGVHATGQVVGAVMPGRWEPEPLRRALNALLPADVWVKRVQEVPLEFHARFDAVARGYVYRLGTAPSARSPFRRRWCWGLGEPLDLARLAAAAAWLPGTHSFRAFAKAGQPERGEHCTVHLARWTEWPEIGFSFHIVANRFLHHMVRYLVGTMVDVGRGRRSPSDVPALLIGEPGLETSPPAPPQGLFLTDVYYDPPDLSRASADLP
jgi:tRNA pseudouridine38-40 synthase